MSTTLAMVKLFLHSAEPLEHLWRMANYSTRPCDEHTFQARDSTLL